MKFKILLVALLSLAATACQNTTGSTNGVYVVNPSDLRNAIGKKEYSLVYFWTTWCGPCRKTLRETLPEVERSIDTSKVQLIVVAVSQDEEKIMEVLGRSTLSSKKTRLDFSGPDVFLTHKFVLKNTLEDLFPKQKLWRNSVPVFALVDQNLTVIDPRLPHSTDEILNRIKSLSN